MAAVKQNGWELEFSSEDIWGDKELVMATVKQNGNAL